jgi:two-component system, OmpR family, heavy metal sensor histidine kinase CusS
MTERLPIGARLTLWYSIVLVLCLTAFGFTVWFGLRQNLVDSRQRELKERVASLRGLLGQLERPRRRPWIVNLREEVSEFSNALPSGFEIQIFDSENNQLFQSESLHAARTLDADESFVVGARKLRIRMALSLDPVDETLRRLTHILFLSFPLAILAAAGGGYWLSKRALAPVRDMAMAAKSIDSSDLSVRLPVPAANDELRLLAGMWNEMLARLQTNVEKIRRFTSDASHDLRTPLATIRASAEIALRRNREPESYKDTLLRILQQTDRATTLVEDLLTLARTDRGPIDMALAPLDLSSALRDTCENLRPLVYSKNLELVQSLPLDSIWINGDTNALMRVIGILVDNALKNTETGWIRIHLETDGTETTVEVQDTGRGISSADLPYVFDRFYRGDQSRNQLNGGSGLGLAIAKRLVEFHQGTISVESTEGQGARFFIRIPQHGG